MVEWTKNFIFFREERPEKLNSILNQFFFGCTHVCLSDDMKCHKNLWNDIRLFHIFIYILQTVWYERNVHQNLIFLRECQSAAFVELKIERVTTEIFFKFIFITCSITHWLHCRKKNFIWYSAFANWFFNESNWTTLKNYRKNDIHSKKEQVTIQWQSDTKKFICVKNRL